MSSWIIYSLLATAIQTVVLLIDKYNLSQQIKDYRGMAIYSAIVALVTGTLLWFITGFPTLAPRDTVLVMFTGVLSIFGAAIYFNVMQKELASNVIFLLQLIPVFVLILAVTFLHETLGIKQLIGFVLIIIPALLIPSHEDGKLHLTINKNIILMFVVDLLFAASAVIFKFVV